MELLVLIRAVSILQAAAALVELLNLQPLDLVVLAAAALVETIQE
jgi:hypothetical protein